MAHPVHSPFGSFTREFGRVKAGTVQFGREFQVAGGAGNDAQLTGLATFLEYLN
jgi:hypothetical protein